MINCRSLGRFLLLRKVRSETRCPSTFCHKQHRKKLHRCVEAPQGVMNATQKIVNCQKSCVKKLKSSLRTHQPVCQNCCRQVHDPDKSNQSKAIKRFLYNGNNFTKQPTNYSLEWIVHLDQINDLWSFYLLSVLIWFLF